MSEHDIGGLLFAAEMYGVQVDQLAAWLGVSAAGARSAAARWRHRGQADSARLGPGPPWVWLTRDGLAACGLPYAPAVPALSRLAHLRAVTAARLALEAAPGYAAAGGYWRSERRLRARAGGRLPLREHLPDGEVHWPEEAATGGEVHWPEEAATGGARRPAAGPGWAGECWAIEAELTPKTVRRTVAIMTEILTRTGDYGCPAAEAQVPGRPPRHARVVYVCSAAARPAVQRAREALSTGLAARVEIRTLPPGAGLRAPRPRAGGAGRAEGVSPPGQPSAGGPGASSARASRSAVQ